MISMYLNKREGNFGCGRYDGFRSAERSLDELGELAKTAGRLSAV